MRFAVHPASHCQPIPAGPEVWRDILDLYTSTGFHLVDVYLMVRSLREGAQLYTVDKGLERTWEQRRASN